MTHASELEEELDDVSLNPLCNVSHFAVIDGPAGVCIQCGHGVHYSCLSRFASFQWECEECQDVVDKAKTSNLDKYVIPQTSSSVIGQLSLNPYDRKWKRTDLPGQKNRFVSEECDMVAY